MAIRLVSLTVLLLCFLTVLHGEGDVTIVEEKICSLDLLDVKNAYAISPNLKRVAFFTKEVGEWYFNINTEKQGPYREIIADSIQFSPDGNRYAYAAITQGGEIIYVVDGASIIPKKYAGRVRMTGALNPALTQSAKEKCSQNKLMFSENSQSYAVAVPCIIDSAAEPTRGAECWPLMIIFNGKPFCFDEAVQMLDVSPDGKHFAARLIEVRDKFIIDGKTSRKSWEVIKSGTFNLAGTKFIGFAERGQGSLVVCDDKESVLFSEVSCFATSDFNDSFAYVGVSYTKDGKMRRNLYINNKVVESKSWTPEYVYDFMKDGKLVYTAMHEKEGRVLMVGNDIYAKISEVYAIMVAFNHNCTAFVLCGSKNNNDSSDPMRKFIMLPGAQIIYSNDLTFHQCPTTGTPAYAYYDEEKKRWRVFFNGLELDLKCQLVHAMIICPDTKSLLLFADIPGDIDDAEAVLRPILVAADGSITKFEPCIIGGITEDGMHVVCITQSKANMYRLRCENRISDEYDEVLTNARRWISLDGNGATCLMRRGDDIWRVRVVGE